jgi:P-type conjugative transfer protein TrbG
MKSLTVAALALLLSVPAFAEEPQGPWKVLTYGSESTPTLNCTPLAACLVALQPGETLKDRFLADSAAWEVESGTAGPDQKTPVLAIKPKRCASSTNLLITTNRRVYTFLLLSPVCNPETLQATDKTFDVVRFTYPEDWAKVWDDTPAPTVPAPGVATRAAHVADLNFDYSVKAGRKAIEPKIVYDDGAKTFIVLRPEDLHLDSPAVFVQGPGGLEAVNFTPPPAGSSTYVVDRVVTNLVLVCGPKTNQRTEIRNRKGGR